MGKASMGCESRFDRAGARLAGEGGVGKSSLLVIGDTLLRVPSRYSFTQARRRRCSAKGACYCVSPSAGADLLCRAEARGLGVNFGVAVITETVSEEESS